MSSSDAHTDKVCELGYCGAPVCEYCPDIDYKVVKTEPVFTPYYRELGEEFVNGYASFPRSNFDRYDLFALQTKLYPQLYGMSPSYTFKFVSYQHEGVMRYTVELFDGPDFIPLTKDDARRVQQMVDHAIGQNSEYCLLFSAKVPVQKDGIMLSQGWIDSVLPYIDIIKVPSYVDDGAIFVSLDPNGDYQSEWDVLYQGVIDSLFTMYHDGVTAAHPLLNRDIIDNWKLQPYEDTETKDETTLYTPSWRDSRFAPNLIDFIRQRIAGNNHIELKLSADGLNLARHLIAHKFNRLDVSYYYAQSKVYIQCDNLEHAITYANMIQSIREEMFLKGGQIIMLRSTYVEEDKELLAERLDSIASKYDIGVELYSTTDNDWGPYVVSVAGNNNAPAMDILRYINKV